MKKFRMKSLKNKNTAIKIFSIVFALLLWSYVRSEVDPEKTITFKSIPVRYENLAELKSNNLSIISPEDAKVDVVLKGKQSNISKVKRENVVASVDFSGYYSGEFNIPTKVQVDANNIIVDSKLPETITFKIDENISKKMKVDLKTIGKLAENFVLGNIKKEEIVKVSGPKTYVDSIDRLVAIVDVFNKDESTVMSAPIIAYNKEGEIIKEVEITPSNIDLEVPILKTETIPVKLDITGDIPEDIDVKNLSIEPNSVSIKGNSAVINKISEIKTVPVTIEELRDKQKQIDIVLPDGVSLIDKDVKFVASTSPIKYNEQTIKIPVSQISVKNLNKKLESQFVEKEGFIELVYSHKNPLEEATLREEDIYASVDLKDLTEGENEVALDISIPEDYKVLEVRPKSVKVNLTKKKIF